MAIQIHGSVIAIFLFSLLEILFMIPIFIYIKYYKLETKNYIKDLIFINGLKSRKTFIYIFLSIAIALGMIFIAPYIILFLKNSFIFFFGSSAFEQAEENLNEFIFTIGNPIDILLVFIMSFFLIALFEELFFRSFLLNSMKLSKNWKMILSSVFFSVYHLITSFNIYSFIYMFFYYFIWGILLCIEFYACKKHLIFPIIT
ncbi:MAG: CPBP family intramembrane metalloprotease, partial [Candidatus Lokiarchaeota archaeon]|nr:CPBP family intramembrane metalloprotease [Candidatus Lokiarchaeota archaeon]